MWKMRAPKHFDGPEEKWSTLDAKSKLILNTIREAVFAILEWKNQVTVSKYKKEIDWNHPPKKFPRKISHVVIFPPYNPRKTPIENTKDSLHAALAHVGIDNTVKKRIATWVDALWSQYKNMSPERFLHRMEILEEGKISKLERDVRFLLWNMKLFRSFWPSAMRETLRLLLSHGNFPGLKEGSHSLKALAMIIDTAKKMKWSSQNGRQKFQKFEAILFQAVDSFWSD
jgi:hypothetical protein